MKVTITNIPDSSKNINEYKIELADQILSKVKPLFSQVELNKNKELTENFNRSKLLKKHVTEDRILLESLLNDYKKQKKIKMILNNVSKLISSGLVYDGSLKNETIILLKVLHKLPMDKLDRQLTQVTNTLNKRFK